MSKWFNKQKVSILTPPAPHSPAPAAPTDEVKQFERLFRLAFGCFRLFALTPGQLVRQKDGYVVRHTRWMLLIVTILVLLAWVALLETFFMQTRTALITGIANHIQFIMNTIALTTAWLVPQLKSADLTDILQDFLVVDRELSGYRLAGVQPTTRSAFLLRYGLILFGLLLLVVYDGFVSFFRPGAGGGQSVEVWYWVSHQLPFVVQAMAFFNAFVYIDWLHGRFRHLNALVEQYYRQGHGFTAFATPLKLAERGPAVTRRATIPDDLQILAIVSRTIDLAQKIESYFGPLFLTVYTALFSVTTIQAYYCYLHLTVVDQKKGLSVESLVLSGGIILANVITIVALPYICERVEHESKQLMSFLSKLSMTQGQTAQHSSVWFSNLIASVHFSALGFFNVNYNMLSGLVAGMVTYLIIFIQFNSMVPANRSTEHYSRMNVPSPDETVLPLT